MWQEVFSPVYGVTDEPPYSAYKVPVTLNKKRHIQAWIDSMEDRAIAARMKKFLEDNSIEAMSAILVPMQVAEMRGIPKEIVSAVAEKRAVSQIMGPFYLALGGLGFFHTNIKNSKLMTDPLFTTNAQHLIASDL